MNILKRAWLIHILHRYPIDRRLWERVTRKLSLLEGLTAVEKAHLRELSTLFLHEKHLIGARNLAVTDEMRVAIAAQACVPVLGLGIELLRGWSEIIVYPDAFRVRREEMDDYGIVHHREQVLSGESWSRGPLILSWRDIELDMESRERGRNVIVHEIAHKLDMLNGSANGMPPLHVTMEPARWTSAFSRAFQQFERHLAADPGLCISPYAAVSPEEFFAVFSETFFCAPEILKDYFSEVYQQLRLYYRQDPLGRKAWTA